ncbi:hypothetical protein KC319_g62 [Hortaea werneckii]|nr:hypothetical protein KC319_g62 [Hortaea werneckii]
MTPASEYLPKIHNTTRRKAEAGADDTVFDIGELLPLCCPSWAGAGDQRNLVENCDFPRAAELQGSRGANPEAENIFLRFLACGGSFGITPAFGGHELLERGSFPCTEVQIFAGSGKAVSRRETQSGHSTDGTAKSRYARRRTETGERLTSAGLPRTSVVEDGDKGGKGLYVSTEGNVALHSSSGKKKNLTLAAREVDTCAPAMKFCLAGLSRDSGNTKQEGHSGLSTNGEEGERVVWGVPAQATSARSHQRQPPRGLPPPVISPKGSHFNCFLDLLRWHVCSKRTTECSSVATHRRSGKRPELRSSMTFNAEHVHNSMRENATRRVVAC